MKTLLNTFNITHDEVVCRVSDLIKVTYHYTPEYASFQDFAVSCTGAVWLNKSGSWVKLSKSDAGSITLNGAKGHTFYLGNRTIAEFSKKVKELSK